MPEARIFDVTTEAKLLIIRILVGERGFEPPTPWSRTNNRCTKLLFRLGLFCVLYRLFAWYSGANGPKLDPNFFHGRHFRQEPAISTRAPEPSRYTAKKSAVLARRRLPQRRMNCPFAGREDPFPKRPPDRDTGCQQAYFATVLVGSVGPPSSKAVRERRMPSLRILCWSVDRLTPRRAAAPFGPEITPFVSSRALRI